MAMKKLPEECVSHILSLTSPKDASRLSAVSPLFRSASESTTVWEKFLPPNYREILSRRSDPDPALDSMTRKALFFFLADNHIVIDNGTLSLGLEKESGKKCFMVAARGLEIIWGNSPEYWAWRSLPDSRFPEVAHLKDVCWLEINARVETSTLSPDTTYRAYFVYKFVVAEEEIPEDFVNWLDIVYEVPAQLRQVYGFDQRPVQLRVEFEGRGNAVIRSVYLDPATGANPAPRERGDGWMEVEMGEFLNERGEDGLVLFGVKEVDDYNSKSGLVVEGIEIRPTNA